MIYLTANRWKPEDAIVYNEKDRFLPGCGPLEGPKNYAGKVTKPLDFGDFLSAYAIMRPNDENIKRMRTRGAYQESLSAPLGSTFIGPAGSCPATGMNCKMIREFMTAASYTMPARFSDMAVSSVQRRDSPTDLPDHESLPRAVKTCNRMLKEAINYSQQGARIRVLEEQRGEERALDMMIPLNYATGMSLNIEAKAPCINCGTPYQVVAVMRTKSYVDSAIAAEKTLQSPCEDCRKMFGKTSANGEPNRLFIDPSEQTHCTRLHGNAEVALVANLDMNSTDPKKRELAHKVAQHVTGVKTAGKFGVPKGGHQAGTVVGRESRQEWVSPFFPTEEEVRKHECPLIRQASGLMKAVLERAIRNESIYEQSTRFRFNRCRAVEPKNMKTGRAVHEMPTEVRNIVVSRDGSRPTADDWERGMFEASYANARSMTFDQACRQIDANTASQALPEAANGLSRTATGRLGLADSWCNNMVDIIPQNEMVELCDVTGSWGIPWQNHPGPDNELITLRSTGWAKMQPTQFLADPEHGLLAAGRWRGDRE